MARQRLSLLLAAGALVLGGARYLFRPEKLFINQRVNEAAPFASAVDPKPLATGRFQGKLHATSGRATVYQRQDGTRYLRLSDFSTSNGPALHVLLVNGTSVEAERDFQLTPVPNADLGELKGNQGDQNYDLPANVDLQQMNTASIYCTRFHANFGIAKLEAF